MVKRKKKAAPKKRPAVAKKKTATKRAKIAPNRRAVSGERSADSALVERTLEKLSTHDRVTFTSARAIGEHILDEYYGGDEQLVRSKSPVKPKSFASLAARSVEETQWDEADLRRAVSMAIVYRSLSESIRDRVPHTYLVRLASIEDLAVRRELAAQIASGELRGIRAKEAVARAGAGERGGGRPMMSSAMRFTHRIEDTIDRALAEGEVDVHDIEALTDVARAELAQRLDVAARRLRELADLMRSVGQ